MSLSSDKKIPDDDHPSSKKQKTSDGHEDVIDLTGEDTHTTHTSNPPPRPPPSPLYLLRVRGIPDYGNQPPLGLHLSHLLTPPMKWILISNYMIDLQWLFSACPAMLSAQQLIFVHGEKHPAAHLHQAIQAAAISYKTTIHSPPLPIAFGTYHSKFFLVQYERGLRVIIHTANLIYPDCNNKTQGVWFQDFPLKEAVVDNNIDTEVQKDGGMQDTPGIRSLPASSSNTNGCSFERDLQQYMTSLGLPLQLARQTRDIIALHDFSSARAHLVASVPGYHKGTASMNSWGHLKLRALLSREDIFSSGSGRNQLVAQFSSLGSIDEPWLEGEFRKSLQASKNNSKLQPPPPGPRGMALVWPTVSEIQNSLEGWLAGNSVPGPLKNVTKPFLQPYYAKFGGQVVARQRAMPHIKTYLRWDVDTSEIGWLFLGSHNLSKAAWGALQKKESQFMIRSYELGVLITPGTEERYRSSWNTDDGTAFSCTSGGDRGEEKVEDEKEGKGKKKHSSRVKLIPWASNNYLEDKQEEEEEEEVVVCVPLPIPFKLPPDRYDPNQDVPWAVDMTPKEAPGSDVWGRKVDNPMGRFYGCDEREEWGVGIR